MTPLAVLLAAAALAGAAPACAGAITAAAVQRAATDALTVTWADPDPVDVFVSPRPNASVEQATRLADDDRDGRYTLAPAGTERRYFLLRDERTGTVTRVAERLLPLEHGSNFRDVGGYPAADGRHVRWGMIYRSGATPLLTDADLGQIRALGLRNLVDLRSSEERVLAPTRIDGVPYGAVGYSMSALVPAAGGQPGNGADLYRRMPTLLAPQLRLIFADLAAKQAPIAYNCSAGQDRTGFATAMILAALGVPRDVIVQDYHLSTAFRRPEYEMPRIDPAAHPNDPAAALFARGQGAPGAPPRRPQPLVGPDGQPFLAAAFDEIDRRWGSVDAYLEREVGVTPVQRAVLRATYLE